MNKTKPHQFELSSSYPAMIRVTVSLTV